MFSWCILLRFCVKTLLKSAILDKHDWSRHITKTTPDSHLPMKPSLDITSQEKLAHSSKGMNECVSDCFWVAVTTLGWKGSHNVQGDLLKSFVGYFERLIRIFDYRQLRVHCITSLRTMSVVRSPECKAYRGCHEWSDKQIGSVAS